MPQSLLFAKSLSLLLEEVQTVSDLTTVRSALLRVRRFSRSHSLTLEMDEGRLIVNGITLQKPVPTLQRLMMAMTFNGVAQINLNAGAVPRELLKLVMMLARTQAAGSDAPTIFEEIRDASLWSIQVRPFVRRNTIEESAAFAADVALEHDDRITRRTQELVNEARSALSSNATPALGAALAMLATVEAAVTHAGLRTFWTAAFDEVATKDALAALVRALPGSGDAVSATQVVLKRAGDAGAEALIDQLLSSDSMVVRRACFDALAEVRRGTTQLLSLLEHDQWFVVRNAACLLGVFTSRSSEPELTATLSHGDERVRAAVVSALLQLDTPTASATVRGAIRDDSPEVRRRAVRGFLAEQGAANVDKLLQALERETELDVQLEFLYVLGALATPDAVQRLIQLCSSDGRYRPPDFRIAAAEALASARLGASVPLLRAMLKDPDIHARAAARHLIRAVS